MKNRAETGLPEENERPSKRQHTDEAPATEPFGHLLEELRILIIQRLSTQDQRSFANSSQSNHDLIKSFRNTRRLNNFIQAFKNRPDLLKLVSGPDDKSIASLRNTLKSLSPETVTGLTQHLLVRTSTTERITLFKKLLTSNGIMNQDNLLLWRILLAVYVLDRGYVGGILDVTLNVHKIKSYILALENMEAKSTKELCYFDKLTDLTNIHSYISDETLLNFAKNYILRIETLSTINRPKKNVIFRRQDDRLKCEQDAEGNAKKHLESTPSLLRLFSTDNNEVIAQLKLVSLQNENILTELSSLANQLSAKAFDFLLPPALKLATPLNIDKFARLIKALHHVVLIQSIMGGEDYDNMPNPLILSDLIFTLHADNSSPFIGKNLSQLNLLLKKRNWSPEACFKAIAICHVVSEPYTNEQLAYQLDRFDKFLTHLTPKNLALIKEMQPRYYDWHGLLFTVNLIDQHQITLYLETLIKGDSYPPIFNGILNSIDTNTLSFDELKFILRLAGDLGYDYAGDHYSGGLDKLFVTKEDRQWLNENYSLLFKNRHADFNIIDQLISLTNAKIKFDIVKNYLTELTQNINNANQYMNSTYLRLALLAPTSALLAITSQVNNIYERLKDIPVDSSAYHLEPLSGVFINHLFNGPFLSIYSKEMHSYLLHQENSKKVIYSDDICMLANFFDRLEPQTLKSLVDNKILFNKDRTDNASNVSSSILECIFYAYKSTLDVTNDNEVKHSLFELFSHLVNTQDNQLRRKVFYELHNLLISESLSHLAILKFFNQQKDLLKKKQLTLQSSHQSIFTQARTHSEQSHLNQPVSTPSLRK